MSITIAALASVAVARLAQEAAATAPAGEPVRIELEYRGYRQFEFELPDEVFAPVGAGFPVPHAGGERFEARVDGANLLVDVLGDGSFKARVEPPPPGTTVAVTLRGKDASGAPFNYAARVRLGHGGWEYSTSGALVGNLGETKFVLVDQDLDGAYGESSEDALVVGRGRVALPMSKVVMLDDGSLHTARLDGRVLELVPYTGPTGTLDMLGGFETRAKLATLQVASQDEVYLDLARFPAGAKVPVGTYGLERGLLVQGDNRVEIAAGRMEPFVVATDATVRPEWGGPIRGEFGVAVAGPVYNFTPDQVWYHGRAGEEYFGWTPLGASPRFVLVDAENGGEIASGIFAGS
jgi:hypothetical protein